MAAWFETIITPEDQYEVQKCRLEINIYFKYMRSLLTSFINRIEALG